jgi:hypothetical protein
MGSPQKVVIPKGLVNPHETTIVEIPRKLQNVGTVVARPRPKSYQSSNTGDSSCASTPGPKVVQKTSFVRRTYPPKSRRVGMGFLHDEGVTYGGRPYEEESAVDESSHGFHPYYPRPPGDRRADISPGDVSYAVGKYGKAGFDPPALLSSTMQGLDDVEGSLYRDFRPRRGSSTVTGERGARPMGSLEPYQSSGEYASPGSSYYKSSMMSSTPNEQTEMTEERYSYDYEPSTTPEDDCPCSGGSSGAYKRFSSGESAGGSDPLGGGPRMGDFMKSIGDLESEELSRIMQDLSSFQGARRKLVYDASSLATAADVSSSLLGNSSP